MPESIEQSVHHSAGKSSVLAVKDLHVRFASESGPLHAVRGLSFSLSAGESLAIVGESGSGKSATAMAIMGLLPASAGIEGSICLQGQELCGRDDEFMSRLRGRSIAMVFQDPMTSLTPLYTVGEQLIESIQVHRSCSSSQALARAVELLDLVGIPEPAKRVYAYPHEFSGGMRQRVLIAMAMANDPDVIIADEPTTALDVTIQAQVLDVLQTACQEANAALVLITHDLGVVARVADRALVMYAGRVVEQADTRSLFYKSRMPYTMGLLGSLSYDFGGSEKRLSAIRGNPPSLLSLPPGCSFASRCPLAIESCAIEIPELVRVGEHDHFTACSRHLHIAEQSLTHSDVFRTDSQLSEPKDVVSTDNSSTVLELVAVKQHFPLYKGGLFRRRVGLVRAVDGIDLYIKQGETVGLIGESGCGKSTTTLSILDLKAPTQGVIKLFGIDVTKMTSPAMRLSIRRQLQIVFQDPLSSLDPRMPVFDLIAEPLGVFDYPVEAIEKRVKELVALVGLDNQHLERYPQQLSGGQCQRVCIARALSLEPKLLILDEPVSALDVSIRAGIINLLQDLKSALGLTYLFVAHDLALVRHIADRIAVMYLGKIVETGTVDSVYENPTHPYTACLLSAMPVPDPDVERNRARLIPIGELAGSSNPPKGCHFHTRCPKKKQLDAEQQLLCESESPGLIDVEAKNSSMITTLDEKHASACHYNHVPLTVH
ncbi:MAG: dipeptide ABC transporter ATP-binding protein [Granulosicoccus sp.]